MSDETTQALQPVEPMSSEGNEMIDHLRELITQRKLRKGNQNKNLPEDKDIKRAIADLMKTGPFADELFTLVSDAPPALVADAAGEVWIELDAEQRRQWIDGLLKQPPDKAVQRQVAIAGRLAHQGGDSTAEILYGVIMRGPKGKDFWPILSEDKARYLRDRFFFNPTWVAFDSSDKEAMQTVLAAFVQTAGEIINNPKLKKNISSYKLWRDFVAWAAQSLSSLEISASNKQAIIERLSAIARGLPGDYRKEVDSLISQVPRLIEAADPEVPSSEGSPHLQSERPTTEETITSQEDTPALLIGQAEGAGLKEEATGKPIAEVTDTIVQTVIEPDDPIAAAMSFICQREAEIQTVQLLIDSFKRAKQRETTLEKECEQERRRASHLATSNASLHTRLADAERAIGVAEDRAANARNESTQLKEELRDARGKLDEAHRRIDREVAARIDDFRGKLKVKLLPIFENKRTTDRQEPNPKLAESLRHLFRQLEEELKDQGVKLP